MKNFEKKILFFAECQIFIEAAHGVRKLFADNHCIYVDEIIEHKIVVFLKIMSEYDALRWSSLCEMTYCDTVLGARWKHSLDELGMNLDRRDRGNVRSWTMLPQAIGFVRGIAVSSDLP